MSKPSITPDLIVAWKERLRLLKEAEKVLAKAEAIFTVQDVILRRPELWERGNRLHKIGIAMRERAELIFRQALNKRWRNRYRLTFDYRDHGIVHARAAYSEEWVRLRFHPSLRLPVEKPKTTIDTYDKALQQVDLKRK